MNLDNISRYTYVSLTCILGVVFWVCLTASIQMDYGLSHVTFLDAASRAANTSPLAVIPDAYARSFMWFLVSVLAGITVLFTRRASLRIVLLAVAILFAFIADSPFSPILGLVLPFYVFGGSDGETWGEAWPASSAVGLWILVTFCYIVIQSLVVVRQRRNRAQSAAPMVIPQNSVP